MVAAGACFDYVIVGAGSAGCVLAARLSGGAGASVLLIEAGGRDLNPFIRLPAGVKQIGRRYDWSYEAEPDHSRGEVVEYWAAGRVLGGGSSVNGMVWVRGDPLDFDEWETLGASGWRYTDVLGDFIRSETFQGGQSATRGGSGPMRIAPVGLNHAATTMFIESARNAGHRWNADYNAGDPTGVSYVQVNQRRGWRHSTSSAYLRPARDRRNLTVALHSTVYRIVISGGEARGVEFGRRNGRAQVAWARCGVVLAAGALATPKLLMLSGIGPEKQLAGLGIPVVAPSPEVGQNLQEHPLALLLHRVDIRTLNREINARGIIEHGFSFVLHGTGAVTSPASHALLFAPGGDGRSEFQVMFAPFGIVGKPPTRGSRSETVTHDVHAMKLLKDFSTTTYVCLLHPLSRGSVTLRSASPEASPVIRHDLLGRHEDLIALRSAVRRTQTIFRTHPFAGHVVDEMSPRSDVRDDADLDRYLTSHTFRGSHPAGTARMGSDDSAVVDPELRVRGVARLWVADASVMPTLPSGNTNAPTIMIAERAARLIAPDSRRVGV
jgi:choline dehydrogenase